VRFAGWPPLGVRFGPCSCSALCAVFFICFFLLHGRTQHAARQQEGEGSQEVGLRRACICARRAYVHLRVFYMEETPQQSNKQTRAIGNQGEHIRKKSAASQSSPICSSAISKEAAQPASSTSQLAS